MSRPPQNVEIIPDEFGKPTLSFGQSTDRVEFNVTHSENLSLIAFTKGAKVGVDLEKVKTDLNYMPLAQSILSPRQFREFAALPIETRHAVFYRCWTLKEAFSKGVGKGMKLPYKSFDISMSLADDPELLRLESEPEAVGRWSLRVFPVKTGYVGALAVKSNAPRVFTWKWESTAS